MVALQGMEKRLVLPRWLEAFSAHQKVSSGKKFSQSLKNLQLWPSLKLLGSAFMDLKNIRLAAVSRGALAKNVVDAALSFHLHPFYTAPCYLHFSFQVYYYRHCIKISQHVRLSEFQLSGKQRLLMPLEQEISLQVGFYMDWSKDCLWRNAAKPVPVVVALSSVHSGVR